MFSQSPGLWILAQTASREWRCNQMFLSEFRNRGLIWHRVNMAKGRYHGGIDFWHAEKRVPMARHIA